MAHRDLSRARNRIVCRLHAVLCDLVPGGFAKEISAAQADQALADIVPLGATAAARLELAHELLATSMSSCARPKGGSPASSPPPKLPSPGAKARCVRSEDTELVTTSPTSSAPPAGYRFPREVIAIAVR